jgi:hypothetical protein
MEEKGFNSQTLINTKRYGEVCIISNLFARNTNNSIYLDPRCVGIVFSMTKLLSGGRGRGGQYIHINLPISANFFHANYKM